MSHSCGAVRFPDGAIYYYDYNGTSDVCVPVLVPHVTDVKLRGMGWRECGCQEPQHEDVEIYSDYGGGFYWPGRACRKCLTITNGLTTDSAFEAGLEKGGVPPWLPDADGWPCRSYCGHKIHNEP